MVLTEDRNREKVAETLLCTSANIFGSNWATAIIARRAGIGFSLQLKTYG